MTDNKPKDTIISFGVLTELNPCADMLMRAAQYYEAPLRELKIKADLKPDEEETLGQLAANIPRKGDVAACLKKIGKIER